MIKSISFKKEFIPLIKQGKKTVTRRIKTNLRDDDICYFKASRFGKKEGYLRICNIMDIDLQEIRGCYSEYNKEGFSGDYEKIFVEFKELWDFLNNKKGYRWEDNPIVYRIKFEYLGENPELSK